MKKSLVAILAVLAFMGCSVSIPTSSNDQQETKSKFSVTGETKTSSDKDTVTGSKVKYSLAYDKSKWILQTPEEDSDAEYLFAHVDGDVNAQVIPERIGLTLASLKKIALENAQVVAPDAKITLEETRKVNGVDVSAMKIEGTIDGVEFIYYGYYFTGKNTSIQLITYTSKNLFSEYEKDLTEFLNGLTIDPSVNVASSDSKVESTGAAETLKGAKVKYSVKYDTSKWVIENGEPGDSSEYLFSHVDGDVYGMVIPERIQVGADAIKKLALDNAKDAAPDAKVTFEEKRKINGKDVLVLNIDGTVEGIKFRYYGYYYTGKAGTVQVLMYTSPDLFEQYKKDMEGILNSLEIEG